MSCVFSEELPLVEDTPVVCDMQSIAEGLPLTDKQINVGITTAETPLVSYVGSAVLFVTLPQSNIQDDNPSP